MWESLTPYSYNLPTDAVVLDGVIFFCSKDMLCYNTKTNKWSKLSPNFQDNGKITSMFASKSYLYVTIEHRHLYKYETGSNTLTKVTWLENSIDIIASSVSLIAIILLLYYVHFDCSWNHSKGRWTRFAKPLSIKVTFTDSRIEVISGSLPRKVRFSSNVWILNLTSIRYKHYLWQTLTWMKHKNKS